MFIESNKTELKSEYTRSFLKTVSAFANERDGQVIFGVSDGGEVLGLESSSTVRHQVENAIMNNFSPAPSFELTTQKIKGKEVVILSVKRGKQIPYLLEGRAYTRSDTSTFPADAGLIRSWLLETLTINFEDGTVNDKLTFDYLSEAFSETINLKTLTDESLLTLGLKKGNLFTNAGWLLADKNSYQFGVDIVKFGENISVFENRLRLIGESILKQFNEALDFFDRYYHDYEVVTGGRRESRVRLPKKAFREALANAIVHRDYYMNANIQVEFWNDYVKVTSPGGLTDGINKEQYLKGGLSQPRNSTIANIFYRLDIIEAFGTGIFRIKEAYDEFEQNPEFRVTENLIEVTLPVINYELSNALDPREEAILNLLEIGPKSRSEIVEAFNLNPSTAKNLLANLVESGAIERFGKGRATRYKLK